MSRFKQIHHPEYSLWQSAVDQVVAKHKARRTGRAGRTLESLTQPGLERPDSTDPMVAGTAAAGDDLAKGLSLAHQAAAGGPKVTEGLTDAAKYCASIWWEIAKARVTRNKQAEKTWRARLGPFTSCDPRYAEAAEQYVEFFQVKGGRVPYRVWQSVDDFIIEEKLPSQAKVAILGDWGTGQPDAIALLGAIARKNPDVVIHLGDVYYSGTAFEMENYFQKIWQAAFDPRKISSFTLAGNHDMYSGGGPYYQLIEQLGQPASYFCLRNDDWQFIAPDTGLHDDDALDATPTFLEDTEVEWLKDKIATAGGRRSVLLSHHQLFSAYEDIGGGFLNEKLNGQVAPILPDVTAWFWGHEHNQVIYKPFQGVLGRCIGHAAYPVGITEVAGRPKHAEAPIENLALHKGPAFYAHGYVMMELDGAAARVSYYQDSDPEDQPMFTEEFPADAGTGA